jgi:hypothetical protein
MKIELTLSQQDLFATKTGLLLHDEKRQIRW